MQSHRTIARAAVMALATLGFVLGTVSIADAAPASHSVVSHRDTGF